ncbi:hypothetical protein CGRA01v4_09343 [Colletotrichum graminicola]|uniref:Uncharacterized protein n=1 Tax=Colletotrichum graminicola (strain M1.001 / M2 / FGSC 10212) TaxID=645133 RepID=E3QPD2_COLGM|nr:uncharacterized protein GLRG_07864 [Colletotrichum graminicola M1.001]EFQ32720.1 hypothetical protein GLRG_07864 [Colletotrichum graminicola M1.001]WDK18058.1 hypothetical protein CGRA01v4_09343 [Colletotrichum graminicola]
MAYTFDGYSEASSARNSPGHQGQPPTGSRQRRRERDGPASGGGGGSEGVYFGTGRFYEENLRNEQQRQRDHQRTPGYWSSSPFGGGLDESGSSARGAWSEEEWGRVFLEALRGAQERRRQERSGGGYWAGGPGMGGGPGPQNLGDGEETRFDDLFGGVFGAAEGRRRGDAGGGGLFGAGAGGSGGPGFFGGGRGTSFEGVFGSPGEFSGREQYGFGTGTSTGTSTGFGVGDQEDVRRGGAGMTWAEFTDLFRHRYDGGSSYGYAGGHPPADLFDSWHTDW